VLLVLGCGLVCVFCVSIWLVVCCYIMVGFFWVVWFGFVGDV
jgi:hypothetical protein